MIIKTEQPKKFYKSNQLIDFHIHTTFSDGKYSLASKKSLLATIIDFLANILDYLIGILTYIVRIVFVGWTAIFDNLLNWTVETVVDTGTDPAEAGLSPIEVENTKKEDRKVTIESLLFNKFDLLNINIFE